MKKIVSVDSIYFRYSKEDNWALENVSLDVEKGEWVAIVGHNGSGKSTLAKLLNGILLPEKGTITIDEQYVLSEESIWDIRKVVGMVFQNPDNQFVGTTVRDDVAFGLENHGIPRDEMLVRITESLEKVRMLEFIDQEPHHLSGGQKQRVAIASVLAIRPSLMIFDESTAMLDPIGRKEVMKTVKELQQKEGLSVISITHELDEVIEADRVIVMNGGKVFTEGTPREVFANYRDRLHEIGLDLPFSIKLGKELQQRGISIRNDALTHEELVNEIWKLYSKV